MVAGLGSEWRLNRMVFKKYPSCGVTQALTELTARFGGNGLALKVVGESIRELFGGVRVVSGNPSRTGEDYNRRD